MRLAFIGHAVTKTLRFIGKHTAGVEIIAQVFSEDAALMLREKFNMD